ncbi:hypothetical protein OPQ81_002802 [Rhizoctonia solani]|nr:hypothetical protein OPQ81_002802 [Rhizoctonia solani]
MPQLKPSKYRQGIIIYLGHEDPVSSVAFSPDGESIVSGSWDHTGHIDNVYSVSYSHLDSMIASGSYDRSIRLWNASTGQQVGAPLDVHYDQVNSVAFAHGTNLLVSGSDDEMVRLWDTQSGKPASPPFKDHTGSVHSVVFSPDDARLVSGSGDTTIRIWDIERGTTVLGPLKGHTGSVRSVAFSPNGSLIISGSYDHTLRLWDVRSGSLTAKPLEGHTEPVSSVSLSPDGVYVASGSYDKTVRIWDLRKGHPVDKPFEEHRGSVNSVAFSPCGGRIASGSHDKTIMIWRLPGTGLDVEYDYHEMLEENFKPPKVEDPEQIGQNMSIQEIFNLLLHHGCLNLASQMDTKQETAVMMSGGGFGDIWRGELHNGTKVAIKVWRGSVIEQCDYKILKRAAREVYYWSKMKHENVHQLMGVIMFKGQSLGMVSEWMENGNLHEYLRKNPGADRFQLCIQVASGVAYIHSFEMVHGDIKALNVLISSNGVPKLTDFGLATMSESTLEFSATTTSQAGSIRWAAPELLMEHPLKSTRSDIYALGMTMLEAFTGTVPYAHCRWDFNVMMMVEKGIYPTRPMDQLNDQRGDQIWNLLVRCWDRDPVIRPSAKQVVESLALIIAHTI